VSSPERIVPDQTEPGIVALHVKRYEFAAPHCVGKEVLDAACGVGYGSAFLAASARRVVGVDLSESAIAYARERYAQPNVEFRVGNLLALELADASFDVVCAFEAIEHLDAPERFVAEARRVLRPDGTLILSTPHVETTDRSPANPFHAVELSTSDLAALLRSEFGDVELFGQHRAQTARHRALQRADVLGLRRRFAFLRPLGRAVTGTPAMADLTSSDVAITRELHGATELIAVCRV
jgi:SAM-dependent methyltransferase